MSILSDLTVWIYIAMLAVSIYGSVLFAGWWIINRAASKVFMYVTFIFVGQVVETGVVLWLRVCGIIYGAEYKTAAQEMLLWPLRNVVLLVALTAMVVHMTMRLIREQKDDQNQGRRLDDETKEEVK